MPTDAFHRWTDRFDRRYRFGIPALPIRKVAQVPPSLVSLPPRAGSLKFPDDDVTAVIELLGTAHAGQAVRLTETPDEKENTSRRRAEVMKEQIESRAGSIPAGYKLRGHVLTAGDPTVKKISGKNYKFYPENWAAISLVADSDADTPPAEPPVDGAPDADTPPAEPPVDGATGEPDGSEDSPVDPSGETPPPDASPDESTTTTGRRGRK